MKEMNQELSSETNLLNNFTQSIPRDNKLISQISLGATRLQITENFEYLLDSNGYELAYVGLLFCSNCFVCVCLCEVAILLADHNNF